jgi:Tol biopolymer transport system component
VPTFGPYVYLANVNGQGDTYAPTVMGDNLEMLVNANWVSPDPLVHIVSATWDPTNDGGSYDAVATLPTIINVGVPEGDPSLDYDGLFLVFSSERVSGYGGRDLWTSVRASRSDPWMPPTHLDALSTADDESSPSLSPDGNTLFFARGPVGNKNLYMATRTGADSGATWRSPVTLDDLDAPGHLTDYSTFFPDARTIVFSSDRETPGTDHLFLARRPTAQSRFVCIEPLGSPLSDNSVEELSPFVTRDGNKLFYAAREPGATSYEIRQSLVQIAP